MYTVIMPKQGLQMTEGTITRWLLDEGENAVKGEPLFEMETDKLAITINSNYTGKLHKILHPEGDVVPITEPVAYILGEDGCENEPIVIPDKAVIVPEKKPEPRQVQPQAKAQARDDRIFITPRAKTRAAERGIDVKKLSGTGYDGLIIERDVLSFKPTPQAREKTYFRLTLRCDCTELRRVFPSDEAIKRGFSRALEAAFRLNPELSAPFRGVKTMFSFGTDGLEITPDGTLLTAAIRGNNITISLTASDDITDDAASEYLSLLSELLSEPLIMLAV